MSEFELFKKVIVGDFNNQEQIDKERALGEIKHPLAKHVNRICNDKIKNLPKDFKGIFVIEESYYTFLDTGKTNTLNHLFLFEEVECGKIRLISYEVPKSINKKDFTNSNEDLVIDYNELEVSIKFNSLIYDYIENVGFYGRSFSYFAEETTFLLEETLSENKFEVNEILKKGDRILIGFDSPIIYIRE